jgi:hypothetical protein
MTVKLTLGEIKPPFRQGSARPAQHSPELGPRRALFRRIAPVLQRVCVAGAATTDQRHFIAFSFFGFSQRRSA